MIEPLKEISALEQWAGNLNTYFNPIGILASLVSLIFAFVQIKKIRTETVLIKSTINKIITSFKLKTTISEISAVKEKLKASGDLIKSKNYIAAEIYTQEVLERLSPLRQFPEFSKPPLLDDIQPVITKISIVHENLIELIHDKNHKIDPIDTHRTISELLIMINKWPSHLILPGETDGK